jgi:general secretion pathway protein G
MSRAFTLVELLIVVVVLGILAAVVIPQFSGAATDATKGSLAHQLLVINDQIQIYIARNNNQHPDFTGEGWGALGDDTSIIGGGHLKSAPRNPAWSDGATDTSVEVVNGNVFGSATSAWVWNTDDLTLYASYYNESTGEVTGVATD